MLGAAATDQPSSDGGSRHPIDLKGTQAFKCLPISASGVMRMTMTQMTQYDDFLAA